MAHGRKSSEQPIWLLVALLLAVVVGIAMFSTINSGMNKFGTFTQATGQESDRIAIETFCKNWIRPQEVDLAGNINPRASEPTAPERERATDSFRKYGWLLAEKDSNKVYLETGPPSGCDCIVFLTSSVGSSSLPPTRAKQFLVSEASTGSMYDPVKCGFKAYCIGKTSIPELGGVELFGEGSLSATAMEAKFPARTC